MGRDNHPSQRQARKLERKQDTRPASDRILIVCEGSKTEPIYFEEIRQDFRLPSTTIGVYPSEGTAPKQVVDYAYKLFLNGNKNKGIKPLAFEQVYAVFDRDEHQSYFDALLYSEKLNEKKILNDLKKPIVFESIPSVPNFELWLLIHFEEMQRSIDRHQVISLLKKHLKGYEKGNKGCFKNTKSQLKDAINRANQLKNLYNRFTGSDPYTDVGSLVEKLIALNLP